MYGDKTNMYAYCPISVHNSYKQPCILHYVHPSPLQNTTRGQGKGQGPPPTHTASTATKNGAPKPKDTTASPRTTRPPPTRRARTIVLHAAPTRYKAGEMRRWLAEDTRGIQILWIRWLLQEPRMVGKEASSLVIYLRDTVDTNRGLRMGRKILRTTQYDWQR